RVPHHLLRHAPDVHARAAEARHFDERRLGSVLRRATARRDAAASTPDDHVVEVHAASSLLVPRLATLPQEEPLHPAVVRGAPDGVLGGVPMYVGTVRLEAPNA